MCVPGVNVGYFPAVLCAAFLSAFAMFGSGKNFSFGVLSLTLTIVQRS